jgi:hypothetical protein
MYDIAIEISMCVIPHQRQVLGTLAGAEGDKRQPIEKPA